MFLPDRLNFEALLERRTLLYGTTNTYKTYMTAKFVDFLLDKEISPSEISILDFAPNIQHFQGLKIGGKISDFSSRSLKCNYLPITGEIIPPRLQSTTKSELYSYALRNFKKIRKILDSYKYNPTNILLINDISIYLHLGSKKTILTLINKSDTFFGNTYYGLTISRAYSKLFSLIERKRVKYLIDRIPNAYSTDWLANSEVPPDLYPIR